MGNILFDIDPTPHNPRREVADGKTLLTYIPNLSPVDIVQWCQLDISTIFITRMFP